MNSRAKGISFINLLSLSLSLCGVYNSKNSNSTHTKESRVRISILSSGQLMAKPNCSFLLLCPLLAHMSVAPRCNDKCKYTLNIEKGVDSEMIFSACVSLLSEQTCNANRMSLQLMAITPGGAIKVLFPI